MSRPMRESGGYGATPATGAVVDFWKYSGTISTSPPTATTRMVSTTIQPTFFSMTSWESFMACGKCVSSRGRHRAAARRNRRVDRLADRDRPRDVVCHQQHSAEEHQAAEEPYRVERVGRLDALDECVGERAVRVRRAPHQALHHAGDPHRRDVEHDAERRDPEVHGDEARRPHLGAAEHARD